MNLRVAFPGGRIYTLRNAFTDLSPGFRVQCLVGQRRLTGLVVGFSQEDPQGEVIALPDKKPLVLEPQLEAVKELSQDYLRPWVTLLFSLLPSSFFPKWVRKVYVSSRERGFTDPTTSEILNYVRKRGGVPLETLKKRFPARTVNFLLERGFLEVREGWRHPSPKRERRFRLKVPLKEALERVKGSKGRKVAVLLSGKDSVSLEDLRQWGIGSADVKELVRRGIVEELEEEGSVYEFIPEPVRDIDGEISFLEGRFEDCIRYISALARAGLSRGKSTLVLFTLSSQLFKAREIIGDSIETLFIHSGMSPSRLLSRWFETLGGPKLVMGTYSSSLVPLEEAFAVVVVDESSAGVRLRQVGDVDLRRLAYILSRKLSARFILSGPSPSVSSYHLITSRDGSRLELSAVRPSVRVIERSPREILTEELYEFLINSDKGKTLFLVSKEGYSYLYCPRCQILCLCPECGSYMTYSKQRESFYCSRCGYRHPTLTCPDCEGEVEDTGFGIEKALEVIERNIGINDDFSFDTYPRWEWTYDTVIVLSADSILSVPSYRSSEEFYLYLMRSKRIARRDLLVQTVFPDLTEVKALYDSEDFYRRELQVRKEERLPPFWRLVKVSTTRGDLTAYLSKVVSPHLQSYKNLAKGTYEVLLKIRDRHSLRRLEEVRRRFSRDIIELRVDPLV